MQPSSHVFLFRMVSCLVAGFVLLLASSGGAYADDIVVSYSKISDTEGGFTGTLDDQDFFGGGIAPLGDLDGDQVVDLAVGAAWDDDGGANPGALWILFLNADGTVKSHQKISATEGGFTGTLDDEDRFGYPVVPLGDLDEDGTIDIAVAATNDDDGGPDRGAIWILFLNPDGTVKNHQKISSSEGGFTGALDDHDAFGHRLAGLGDHDGDGVLDLATTARNDDDGGSNRGAIWILFLNPDGTVKDHQKISDTEGGFTPPLHDTDHFGYVAALGDLDGDGTGDLAAAELPDWGSANQHPGIVWILFLNPDATVKAHQEISATAGGFGGALNLRDNFGDGIIALGDLDGDEVTELAVGAAFDDDGGADRGAVWILYLNEDGTVKSEQKISDTQGGFDGGLDNEDLFGTPVASVPDLDGDGLAEGVLVVGAHQGDDGGFDRGAIWLIHLEDEQPPETPATQAIGLAALALAMAALLARRLKRS